MSRSPTDFLLMLIVLRNPLLQLEKSAVARASGHRLTEVLGDTFGPRRCHPRTLCRYPTGGRHARKPLSFYYVQQPCLDYVLFFGFFSLFLE